MLLGYPIKQTAAKELLYGGVRIQHLKENPFPLKKIKSEKLHIPTQKELQNSEDASLLAMQLPQNYKSQNQNENDNFNFFNFYNQTNLNIMRQVDGNFDNNENNNSENKSKLKKLEKGYQLKEAMAVAHHPERHFTSSLPYTKNDTNNILGFNLFFRNVPHKIKNDCVRVKVQDCYQRLLDYKMCLEKGKNISYPLTFAERAATAATSKNNKLNNKLNNNNKLKHLRGGPSHPSPSSLSIFTRPADLNNNNNQNKQLTMAMIANMQNNNNNNNNNVENNKQAWMPLQMIKPISVNYNYSIRGSGTRGPHGQLYQERLDQKGFGWKRKSRSLWQQDVATAGFRPHRYF